MRTSFWLALGALAYTLHRIFGSNSILMENVYARGIFPVFRTLWDFTFGFSPIPWIYLFLAGLLIWFIIWISRNWKERFIWIKSKKRLLAVFFLGLIETLGIIIFLFYILWGFNYNRIRIEESLNLDVIPLDAEAIREEMEWAVDKATEAREAIPGAGEEVLTAENFPKNLESVLRRALKGVLHSMDYPTPGRVRVRKLWPSTVLMGFGGSGIYIPFVFEGYTSSGLLPVSRPFNMAHEMSHGYGFTEEGTCNFLALLACKATGNPAVQYSGHLVYWNFIAREFRRAFPDKYRDIWETLPIGMKSDLRAVAENWRKYEGRLQKVSEKVYAEYLKSQGIKEGLKSYNRLIVLISAYKKKIGMN